MVPVFLAGEYETRLVPCTAEVGPEFEHRFDVWLSIVCSSQLCIGGCEDDMKLKETAEQLKRLLAPRQCRFVTEIPPGSATDSTRAATFTPSPNTSPVSSMTMSPRLIPSRNCMRRDSGNSRLRARISP